MYYVNFDHHITAHWCVEVKAWPQRQFCSPADISTRNEVEILFHAWQSGVTHFKRMTDEAFQAWEEARFEAVLATGLTVDVEDVEEDIEDDEDDTPNPNVTEGVTTSDIQATYNAPSNPSHSLHPTSPEFLPITAPTTESITSTRGSAGHKRPTPSTFSGVRAKKSKTAPVNSSVTSSSSEMIVPVQKKRKEHSDKGVRRGPRKAAVS